ncbi:purine and uridine phosphorylase [Zopfia rhizophila CBS 207.26]|uniref:Purine and uridine phosphorylase n=1 Tax=Zopfia rhizophila CBS 207.26 TaxID=1314779 RepID=A0A6A6DEF1_9PEZI|nr:purine and uridine phosphorylase [Zopfia rhizophila CBS 207.26]
MMLEHQRPTLLSGSWPNEDYTVGWVCAICTEYVAAQAFLDEKHEGPECVSPNDNNDYTLGKIGKHNVVIAVLPDGEYGISSVAGVARDMLHSFPNIRIGLMVGVGGGAPSSKHDIRLGDIVVSSPRDGKGGVFQYDFGKTIQDQSFRPTGFLNQPPGVLRAAVNGLKAQYESEGHRLEEAIDSILEKKPRLRQEYKRPDPSSDSLYQTGVTHPPNDETSCAAVCGNDLSNLILRRERTEDEDNPAIHYGLIASANQLMKDALVRDTLAAEKDVLCFEMEAAGLMNHFPCLVIRGVCDYSDSHKSKEWQGYAAMAAAAYTKDLLYRIAANRVEAEKRIVDVLSDVREGVDELLRVQHNQEYEAILKWLTPIDYAPQQSDYIRRREEGTGEWLLNSNEFQDWINQRKATLFCLGIPGAGKTIISSIVVDYLNAKFRNNVGVGVAYIYCSYQPQQEQKAEDLLSSLLKQLAQERPTVPSDVQNLYDRHRTKRTRPSFDEVVRALHSAIQLYSRVFIIIDALDEYYASNNEGQKRLLSEVFSLQDKVQLSLFATSRFVAEIASQFKGCISKEIQAQDDDVLRYVNGRIPQLLRSQGLENPDIQETIRRGIVKAANGMFLLARLHMDSLMSQPTLGHIKRVLQNLPQGMKGLDETYAQAMRRIEGQEEGYRELAKHILAWITYAKRALSTAEIQHALAVHTDKAELDEDFLPKIEMLGSICAGLIVADKNSDIVRLVHYTTQEYFERTSSLPNAHREITATCVTYLSFDTFATGFCATDEDQAPNSGAVELPVDAGICRVAKGRELPGDDWRANPEAQRAAGFSQPSWTIRCLMTFLGFPTRVQGAFDLMMLSRWQRPNPFRRGHKENVFLYVHYPQEANSYSRPKVQRGRNT